MATYEYTISGDFGGALPNFTQLDELITNDDGVNVTFDGISNKGDIIYLKFESTLPEIEKNRLDVIIQDYEADFSPIKRTFYTTTVKVGRVHRPLYIKVATVNYTGSKIAGPINYVDVIAHMDYKVVSYDLRLVDKTHNCTIAEKIFCNNLEDEIIDLGPILQVPEDPSILELHVRANGAELNHFVHVDSINIYHGN
jgi:hypothetical protein